MRGRRSEVRGRRSEVERSEVQGQRSEVEGGVDQLLAQFLADQDDSRARPRRCGPPWSWPQAEAKTAGDDVVGKPHRPKRGRKLRRAAGAGRARRAGHPGHVEGQDRIWPSRPGKATLLVCGRRAAASLWTITPGRPALRPASNRSRSAVNLRHSSSCSFRQSSRAVCMPTANAHRFRARPDAFLLMAAEKHRRHGHVGRRRPRRCPADPGICGPRRSGRPRPGRESRSESLPAAATASV